MYFLEDPQIMETAMAALFGLMIARVGFKKGIWGKPDKGSEGEDKSAGSEE